MLARYGRMFSFPINHEINTDNDAISTNNNNDSNNINAAAAATNSESILSREECIEEILGILRSRLGLGNLLKKIYPITSTASTTPTSSSNTDVKNNKLSPSSLFHFFTRLVVAFDVAAVATVALLATTLTKANSCPSIPSALLPKTCSISRATWYWTLWWSYPWKPKEKPLETHPLS